MPKRTLHLLSILFAFTFLGCSLTSQLQQKSATPTPTRLSVVTAAPPSFTPFSLTIETPGSTRVPDETPIASADAEPVPSSTFESPSPTYSLTPTDVTQGGLHKESVPAPGPLPADVTLMREPLSLDDHASAAALADSEIPVRDLRSLAIRLRGVRADVPHTISDTSPDYEIGTVRTFKVDETDGQGTFLVEAELRYKTDHLYMWVERGVDLDQSRLETAADTFESQIYPINRAFFGSEWTPGVDGDPHLSVLHARGIGSSTAGYYWSTDEYPAEVRPDSNQMEMFYINADNADVGSVYYLGTLAHEFQHMIHWFNDRNEETWLNEGMSELASFINGFDPGGFDYAWSLRPDTQLNTWSKDGRTAHYGGAYLLLAYLLDRFGEALTQAVVAHPANGIASIDAALSESGIDLSFKDVFADWAVAAYLDDPELADGRFGYDLIDTAQPVLDAEHTDFPVERVTQVSPYGVDYIYLRGGTDLTLDFYGDTQARLLDTQPHSGDHFWYSNRGDDSNMRLTRAFDLNDVSGATLRFQTWYDVETDWDYGYAMVSTDGGVNWQILRGPSTTAANPKGHNYGWAYTGQSGSGPSWVAENVDLGAYAGQKILLRFEYITDDAINRPGWALDDITIPELDYLDDVENGDGGWVAEGFVRTNNVVPQEYLAQLISFGPETTVRRLPMREDQSGRWQLALRDADHAVLIVSALAPVTTEAANYYYRLEEN